MLGGHRLRQQPTVAIFIWMWSRLRLPQLSFMQRSLIRHRLWRVGRCGGPVG
jgi:hypothetical protein